MHEIDNSVLVISPTFSPDIGGVETHLDDYIRELGLRKIKTYVCTHKPIVTSGIIDYQRFEYKFDNYIEIRRFWWFGINLFHILENYPILQFFYLVPYLLIRIFLLMLFKLRKVKVIHAHGISAALIGVVLKTIFRKRLVISTHAIYEIDCKSLVAKIISHILSHADNILCLSKASKVELIKIGVKEENLDTFRYWIDLERFRAFSRKEIASSRMKVLFVGRYLEKKGIGLLINIAAKNLEIDFVFTGVGPDEDILLKAEDSYDNIINNGKVENSKLSKIYNDADVFIIPSLYEEGFGRTIMEALACGVPVIGSRKGGICEAVDETVAILVDPTVENFQEAILKMFNEKENFKRMRSLCRLYAENNFSSKNVEKIISTLDL